MTNIIIGVLSLFLMVFVGFAGYFAGKVKTYDDIRKFYSNMMDDMETRLPRMMKSLISMSWDATLGLHIGEDEEDDDDEANRN